MYSAVDNVAQTAFGERVCALSRPCAPGDANPRYGYAGAWGYQAHDECSYFHVGARYYDSGFEAG